MKINNLMALSNKPTVENIHVKFCKYILGVHGKATNAAVIAELGSYPIMIEIACKAIKYWIHLQNYNQNSLVYKCLLANYDQSYNGKDCWMKSIFKILHFTGMQETWHNLGGTDTRATVSKLKNHLENMYEAQWHRHINGAGREESHKLRTYCTFKRNFSMEPYLLSNIPVKKRNSFSKLRISAHTLAIETGRYTRPKTPVCERKCVMCNTGEIEDEKHIVLFCNYYEKSRRDLIDKLKSVNCCISEFGDSAKFEYIMNTGGNSETCSPIVNFVHSIFDTRKAHLGI